ncbi:MAG: class I SAM-dependent methyltransferase [Planctomycetes bacterium]|nr:class I SAM-dependent methyltransferase [Planctomycetota bacterium]
MNDLEISDEILAFDPDTLQRLPVRKSDVVDKFAAQSNRRAIRIVRAMADRDGILDPDAVDRRLVRVHCEMQRISEGFQHGQRVAEVLRPLLEALRSTGVPRPIRIVDVGCGTGFVLRWLAARGDLGADVELVGADYHPALVGEAMRLAALENLKVTFRVANAFRLDPPGSVFLSTGVIHHFRGPALAGFFRSHDRPETRAFVHFDFLPSFMAPFGSWLFHAVRMRDPLAKHDGVVSAIRAYSGAELVRAAGEGAGGFVRTMYSTRLGILPIPRAFHSLIGLRPEVKEAFLRSLGSRSSRLGAWE